MAKEDFEFITLEEKLDSEQTRRSLTYWQDVWRRLKKNRLSMFGLVGVILVVLFGIFGPLFTPYSYSDQILDYSNLPPRLDIYQIDDDMYVYVSKEYRVLETDEKGELIGRIQNIYKDTIKKIYYFAKEYELTMEGSVTGSYPYSGTLGAGEFYSERWGIGFKDSTFNGVDIVEIFYIDSNSPLQNTLSESAPFQITTEYILTEIILIADPSATVISKTSLDVGDGAEEVVSALESNLGLFELIINENKIISINFSYGLVESSARPAGYEDAKVTVTYDGTEIKYPTDNVSNSNYLLGTDKLGRDILTRVMFGARISLLVAFIATIVNFVIGITYGSFSGYKGGSTDNFMMRIVDIINSIPLMLYVILLMVVFREFVIDVTIFGKYIVLFNGSSGLGTIVVALGSVYWVGMARLVRGQILGLKEQEYVLAARTIGVSTSKIIVRHLVPNTMGPIIVSMTMMIPSAVFTEAFLSFVGLGISAPKASWGTLANDALGGLTTYPYQLFFPSAAIAITMLAFNFLGDGLRDALDPRLRKG